MESGESSHTSLIKPINTEKVNNKDARLNKKLGHDSEWILKALEEGGSGKRKCKRISNPDFIETEVALHSVMKYKKKKDEFSEKESDYSSMDESIPINSSQVSSDISQDGVNCETPNLLIGFRKGRRRKKISPKKQIGNSLEPLEQNNSSNTLDNESLSNTIETPSLSTISTPGTSEVDTSPTTKRRGKRVSSKVNIRKLEPPDQYLVDVETPFNCTLNNNHSTRRRKTVRNRRFFRASQQSETDTTIKDPESSLSKIVRCEKDTWCWICHKEVDSFARVMKSFKQCDICTKIFHSKCFPLNYDKGKASNEGDVWLCNECRLYKQYNTGEISLPYYVQFLGKEIYIEQLKYIIDKTKKYSCAKELTYIDPAKRPDYFLYIANPVDFQKIDKRLKNFDYKCLETLFEDFKWMLHNSFIYNGGSSKFTKDLKTMLRYLRMDLYDLDACAECYINAYTTPTEWFIRPCQRPHLLVWAQLKSYPFWPAKVYDSRIEEKEKEILVKFFGDHNRSWIPYSDVFLYSLDPPSVCVHKKRKTDMLSSLLEMSTHIHHLKQKFDTFNYPEQNVLVGLTAENRLSQLKQMIPLYNPEKCFENISAISKEQISSLQTSSDIDESSRTECESNNTTDSIKLDLTNKSSKLHMLSLLEERMLESRSDAEDSETKTDVINERQHGRNKIQMLSSLEEKMMDSRSDAEESETKTDVTNERQHGRKLRANRRSEFFKKVMQELIKKKHRQPEELKKNTDTGNIKTNDGVIDERNQKGRGLKKNMKARDVINGVLDERDKNCLDIQTSNEDKNKECQIEGNESFTNNSYLKYVGDKSNQILDQKSRRKILTSINKKSNVKRLNNITRKGKLFKYKSFSSQLFNFRRYQHVSSKSNKPPFSTSQVNESFGHANIQDVRVVLDSLTVDEIKEMKRKVKVRKFQENNKTFSSVLQGRCNPMEESRTVPIEETMRITSDDISDLQLDQLYGTTMTETPEQTEPSSKIKGVQGIGKLKTLRIGKTKNEEHKPYDRKKRTKKETHLDTILNTLVVGYLKDSPDVVVDKAALNSVVKEFTVLKRQSELKQGRLIEESKVIKEMQEEFQYHIMMNQYNAEMEAMELALHQEFVAKHDEPELTLDDYDEIFAWREVGYAKRNDEEDKDEN